MSLKSKRTSRGINIKEYYYHPGDNLWITGTSLLKYSPPTIYADNSRSPVSGPNLIDNLLVWPVSTSPRESTPTIV